MAIGNDQRRGERGGVKQRVRIRAEGTVEGEGRGREGRREEGERRGGKKGRGWG